MNRKIKMIIAALGAMLLSFAFTGTASATIVVNGQTDPGTYECTAPCSVTVSDTDGGSYYWSDNWDHVDGASNTCEGPQPSFSRTYQAGYYQVVQSADCVSIHDWVNIDVTPASDQGPEDIELISPARGDLPLELKFRTSRANADAACYGSCSIAKMGRSGPQNGKYIHTFRIVEGDPGPTEVDVWAWNESQQYSVDEEFDITITGGESSTFLAKAAKWRLKQKGGKCQVKVVKKFGIVWPYKANLKLRARAPGMKKQKIVRAKGEPGDKEKLKAKFKLNSSQVAQKPKLKAVLVVKTQGSTFKSKDKRRLKPKHC